MSKRLGRGLDALIPSVSADDEQVFEVRISELRPNPYQPRKEFDETALKELSQSIEEHGIIQPLVVRKSIRGYEIVAGERRFRAAKMAAVKQVPVVVKDFTEQQVMEIALIENLQREDLNAIEIAQAYKKLMDEFDLTQDQLAAKVGKSRPNVANFLRLLQLPKQVQDYVSRGTLSMGHARTLISLEDEQLQVKLAKRVTSEKLSVRELEDIVQKLQRVSRETKKKKEKKKDLFLRQYEEKLREKFGTSVNVVQGRNKGKIEITFFSKEDLERILELLES